jgi:uncharacterized membrane protein
MRRRVHLTLAGALCLSIVACLDRDLPLEAGPDVPAAAPELSVVTFGMTIIGDPTNRSSANAINDLGQILFVQGPEPFRPFLLTNGSILRLPHPFDADRVQAFDLNANATAVGDVDGHGAAWVGGELTLLDRPEAYASAQAVGINDAGRIVGHVSVVNQGTVPVMWPDKDAGLVVLAAGGRALDVNNTGAIVGEALVEGSNSSLGVYWAGPTSTPQPVRGPDGQPCGVPYGINNRGEMVGFCRNSAAYWASPDANAILLVGGPGIGYAIYELGLVVGSAMDGAGHSRPTLWSKEGSSFRAFDLGIPTDRGEGLARQINNRGQAVGGAFGDFQNTGLLWQVPVRVETDVVPTTGTTVRLGKGRVSVALLGSPWFHAGDIDPGTLTLGNDDGIETPVSRKKNTPVAKLTDVNRDRLPDLVAEFDVQTMTRSGDLVAGTQTLIVQGRLRDGVRLRGADEVTAGR